LTKKKFFKLECNSITTGVNLSDFIFGRKKQRKKRVSNRDSYLDSNLEPSRGQERSARIRAIGQWGESREYDNKTSAGSIVKRPKPPYGRDYDEQPIVGIDSVTFLPRYGRKRPHEVKTKGTKARDILSGSPPRHPRLSLRQRETQGLEVDEYSAPPFVTPIRSDVSGRYSIMGDILGFNTVRTYDRPEHRETRTMRSNARDFLFGSDYGRAQEETRRQRKRRTHYWTPF
jgi:hypothetical protein